jgi:hypothetical protein
MAMQIKGTSFLGRAEFIKKEFGEETWKKLMGEVTEAIPYFQQKILPLTLIPAESFLAFNDLVTERLYHGDKKSYWVFGERSALWALTDGPYKSFLRNKNLKEFIKTLANIWPIYFTEGKAKVKIINEREFEIIISEVEPHHLYFEYLCLGYVHGGLKLVGAKKVEMEAIRGFSKGDPDILYRVRVE